MQMNLKQISWKSDPSELMDDILFSWGMEGN